MNLSTSGSNPSEDEDEDCVITLVKSGKSNSSIPITTAITTQLADLRGGDSLTLLGVKKERAENGNLYVFLDVKEDDAQGIDSPFGSDPLEEGEECGGDDDGVVVFRDIEDQQVPEEDVGRPQRKPVDLTPFLSYLSNCINESRTTEQQVSTVISAEEEEDEEEDFFSGSGVQATVEIHPDSSASCVVATERNEISSDEKTDVLWVPKEFASSGVVGAPPPDLNSASAATLEEIAPERKTVKPLGSSPGKFYDNGGTQAMELDHPVPSPAAAAAAPVDEEEDCYDDGACGCEEDAFNADGVRPQKQETSGSAAQEQQDRVETKEKAAEYDKGTQEQQQQVALSQTPTCSESSEVSREFSTLGPEICAMALAKISNNTDDGLRVETMNTSISPPTSAATGSDMTAVVGPTNQTSSLTAGTRRRNLISPLSMFSWCGNLLKKLPSGRFEIQKSFENLESRKPRDDSSPCSSQSHGPLGSSKGSESNNPKLKRRGGLKTNKNVAALVPASSLCNSIGEEHGSEKCEGSPSLGVVSTPLQIHNLKGAPRKCRALRRVVCPFEYEESWKGLMPPNGGVPEKERQKVIQALYTFEELRSQLREAEGRRVAKGRAEGIACRERPDLKACTEMRLRGLQVNSNEYIGNVPGVCVGDRFWYRIEMVVIGLHKQLEAGIAFISRMKSCSGISVATSIVMKHSGNPYRDDRDDGELITYTGQGGLSNRSGAAHSVADQVLTRGNEALKNSYEGHLPIRVIRGEKDKRSPTGDVYTYIGLYHILQMRYEPGKDGNLVYMFDLQRQGGQHPLPICASKPVPQIANKATGLSTSLSLKRKWDNSLESGDASSPCSSKEQWGIPLDFSNVNQALYVRGS
ncbi:unnamed protein product [Sphagnum troendelagicum]|uniref:YDG domain-containing protein n=1 Tax=Sphagnum troendelagicum TaxID=128251 RepID=A0ABP0TQ49_9BRYO